ncbi:HET-domain-containing protein [Xylaria palmicola]|nr:HET-domain-containing protein [Xylaria palmicola]
MYQKLDPDSKCIRVLELLPGMFDNDLRVILRTVSLDDKPSYEALSYTWGGRTEGRSLKIWQNTKWIPRSSELPITDNLFKALRRLRKLSKARVLWVDAVCINQDDVDERSAQVALMAEIYSNATSTAIWLGDVEDTNVHDTDMSAGQKALQLASSILPMGLLWNSDCLPMDHAIQTTTPSWKDRGWIIQEYALSRQPYFQFGSKTRMIDQASPYGGQQGGAIPDSGLILEKKIFFPGLGGLTVRLKKLDLIKAEMERGKSMSLYHAALATGASETTDARDKVYSLLSFLNPIERGLIHPDYRASMEIVFSRATYASLKGPTALAILELIKFDVSGAPSTLPTWTYDFRTSDPYPRHEHDDDSAKMSIPSLKLKTEEGAELEFDGVCVDVVAGTTPPLPGFWEECADHRDHGIDTDSCIVADLSRKVAELVQLTESLIRGSERSDYSAESDKPDGGKSHRQFIFDQIFTADNERIAHESVIMNLFSKWEMITTHIGIPQANTAPVPQSSNNDEQQKFRGSPRPMSGETRYYCNGASGGTVLITTTNGNLGIAPTTIKAGDKLVLPLCKTATGEVDAQVLPFQQPLALILRERENDKWTFHGLAHLDGLGDKAQYFQHSKQYVIC